MLQSLNSQSMLLAGLFSTILAMVSGLAVYRISHYLISRSKNEDLKDPINSLFRMIGMLVSLMLSLAFAEVVTERRAIENAIEREGAAIADTFNNLERFDSALTLRTRETLAEYTQSVIDDEWSALSRDRLSERTAEIKRQLEEEIWQLEPVTTIQKAIWSQLLKDLELISNYRLSRMDAALTDTPLYLHLLIAGFLLSMAFFGAYKPSTPVTTLLCLYAGFLGAVLYVTATLSDPFQGGIGVQPDTFEYMVEIMRRRL